MPLELMSEAQKGHVKKLRSVLAAEKSKSVPACGGNIEVGRLDDGHPEVITSKTGGSSFDVSNITHPTIDTGETQFCKTDASKAVDSTIGTQFSNVVRPIQIRFGNDGEGSLLTLPYEPDSASLKKLLQARQPASLGVGGEEVYDEIYRKANKLSPEEFCTSFCSYTAGIVDIVNQLLVPCTYSRRSVKAVFCKFDICEGPAGLFKPHVDTPWSKEQVGSLVVALPSLFEGGVFSVTNGGTEVEFNGAEASKHFIQWAAFYSDCAHEVYEVTSGRRIPLTYNLMPSPRQDLQAGTQHSPDALMLPLARSLKEALSATRFLFLGSGIGVCLHHRYPHTHKQLSKLLLACLKGVDMAVYETGPRALGLKSSLTCTSESLRGMTTVGTMRTRTEMSSSRLARIFQACKC